MSILYAEWPSLLKITKSSIHSALSVFLHCADCEFFTQWCSLQNLFVLYIWLNILSWSFWGLFSGAFQATSGWSYLSLLPNLLVVSCPLPLVTVCWWNKHLLTMIRIFTTFSHRNLCSLFYPYAVFLFMQHLFSVQIELDKPIPDTGIKLTLSPDSFYSK